MMPDALVLRHPDVVVASEIAPVDPIIESADVVVVAVPSAVVVARYKLPPALRSVHCDPPPLERDS